MATPIASVEAELVRLVFRHVPAVLAANLFNCSLMVAALWYAADRRILVGWAALVGAVTLARLALWLYSRPKLADQDRAPRLAFLHSIGTTISGVLWGGTAFLFMQPEVPTSLILVSFVIGGMAAGSVTALAGHLPAFYCYLAASMLPFELRLLTLGDRVSLAMCGMGAVYAIGLVIMGRSFNGALTRALVLNEENTRLLASREAEVMLRTADLRAANADLEREIGERKRAECEAKEARAEAEQANMAKSRFLAAASHDLRQPLQSMYLFASSLHRFVADRKGNDALLRIERSLDILKGMLDSLFDLSRLDVNVTERKYETFAIKPMLDDIVVAYQRIAASKGIELKCGPLADLHVHSDQNLLGRMIRNLVENALRYTERGQIVLSCRALGDIARIAVDDTGIGIPSDQLERIFEEFHQVGNPERDKARGLGLGLAIVQRLSRILEHPVEVQSELGVGSTFSIDVPVAAPVAATAPRPVFEGATADGEEGRQVMVVDDDPLVLLALSTMFEEWGYDVMMAGSEDEAVAQVEDHAPQLVIADYRLRNGRVGTDAIRSIRARSGHDVPGIVLTGETGGECLKAAEALGAMLLHKPVTPHDLAHALKCLLGERAAT